MAYTNNIFRGSIDGKTVWSYAGKLDYDIESLDDRLNKIKEILNLNDYGTSDDRFWQDVWDIGICKSSLNKDDELWSNTNVSKSLSKYADYLLSLYKHESNTEKIRVYTDKELFDRIMKEEECVLGLSDANKDELSIFVSPNKNYKLSKKIEVDTEDIKKYDEIKAYNDLKNYMLYLHKNPNERRKLAKEKGLDVRTLYRILNRNRKLLDEDMLDVKISKERPIIWKTPLKDSGNEIDWDCLDMFDPKHVKALLQVNKPIDIYNDILISRDELISRTELTDTQREILELWRRDKTQMDIASLLNMNQSDISKQIDKIVKKIIDTYEKEYEENYYYLNIVKGKYKKCNKCNKIKLLHRFDKKKSNKDGYKNNCKCCN